jgi:predicted dehydrogenase
VSSRLSGSGGIPLKILLIGVGRWGEQHLRVLTDLGVEVWVADLDPSRLERAAPAFGVDRTRAVRDFRAALGEVDAVDLVTPADSHLALATECLESGKDCFIEKPVARTLAEARALAEVAERTGRIVQVGHIFRFHPATEIICQRLAEGRLGQIRYVAGRFAGFKRPRTDVGVTQTDAIHYFDLFTYVLGQRPAAVTAVLRDYLGRGLDDLSFVTVEYGTIPAFIEAGYFTPVAFRDCLVVGSEGSLVADFGQFEVTVFRNLHERSDGHWVARAEGRETIKVAGEEPLRGELGAFLEAVRSRQAPLVRVADGVLALHVVEAARLSSRLGRRVTLEEVS